jgi:pimeloyl-ACP methyl ester carboxylesterase
MQMNPVGGTAWQSGWVVVPQVRGRCETVYGVRTHYVCAGEGEPLVLIHGGGPGASGAAGFAKVIPALARHFRVYAIDLIGNGASDKPAIEYSFQTQVEHVAGFVDALGLATVNIAGNSQGAYVAIKYALDHPARVRRAALISTATLATACGISDGGKAEPLPRFDGTRESLRRFMSVIVNDASNITDELIERRFAIASQPAARAALQSIGGYRQLVRDDGSQAQVFEVRERIQKLRVPFCFIWGERDRSAPLDPMGRELQRLLPHAPFWVVAGAGHQVQTDRPEECSRLLIEFLAANS